MSINESNVVEYNTYRQDFYCHKIIPATGILSLFGDLVAHLLGKLPSKAFEPEHIRASGDIALGRLVRVS